MTTQQKALAINALTRFALHIRDDGSWYVSLPYVEIGGNGMLSSIPSNGATPEQAIEACWASLTKLEDDRVIVTHAMDTAARREVRWNGFMWREALR
jgi:hypothetical protein